MSYHRDTPFHIIHFCVGCLCLLNYSHLHPCVWMFLRCIKILMPHYEDEFHLMSALNVIHRYLLDFLYSIFLYKARKKHSHINVWIFNMKTIFDCVCKMNKPSWCEVHHLKFELCKRYHSWYILSWIHKWMFVYKEHAIK